MTTEFKFGLNLEKAPCMPKYWIMQVLNYKESEDSQRSYQVRVTSASYDRTEPLLTLWADDAGDEFEVIDREEWRRRVFDMMENEEVSMKVAQETLAASGKLLRAEPLGIPVRSMIDQARARWNAISLLVTPIPAGV